MSGSTSAKTVSWFSSENYIRWNKAIQMIRQLNHRQPFCGREVCNETLCFTKETVPAVRELLRSNPDSFEIEIEIEESSPQQEEIFCDSCGQNVELFENEEEGRSLCEGCHPFFQQNQVPMSEETSPSQIHEGSEDVFDQVEEPIIPGMKDLHINFGAPSSIQLA